MANIPEVFLGFLRQIGTTTLIGSPATIREGLAALEAAGAQEVILLFPDALHRDSLRFFASEFI